ncbi:MAG: Holliday junction resolvase RuvX [Candidatus Omnitrophica bacterium]|nr:Holliday junction resolvase RuvX [Candidatus Omnitrophota bacterium]
MRILALDVGRKRIGVALSDPMGIVAQGVKSLEVKDEAQVMEAIGEFIRDNEVGEVVVGLPLNMDGSEGPMTKEVTAFAARLKEKTALPLKMWDERLTSLQIERELVFFDVSRAKRKKINDMLAAQIILQNYLDSKKKNDYSD